MYVFFMVPSNLNLNIGKTAGYNNKILISSIEIKIGSNKNINKVEVYHQKSWSHAALSKTTSCPWNLFIEEPR